MPPTADSIRRIAITTGGGDAPGLNAVIRAAVLSALRRGWECVGIRDGYDGLLDPGDDPKGGLVPLTARVRARDHPPRRHDPGHDQQGQPPRATRSTGPTARPGRSTAPTRSSRSAGPRGIDALIAVGGDGSMAIAAALAGAGLRVVGVPKTIDNDLDGTVVTFGFDTRWRSPPSASTACTRRPSRTSASSSSR